MARLTIRLLGSFQVTLDAIPVTSFDSEKTRTLLAYLAVENSQPQPREKLAALFWPEQPSKRALSRLNQALYNLRIILDDHQSTPPLFLRTQETVQLNPNADFWTDVHAFGAHIAAGRLDDLSHGALLPVWYQELRAAVALYRGDFLPGLENECGTAFCKWALAVRHRLQRQVLCALHLLVDYGTDAGEPARALPYARRQVELDPLGEPASRQLMTFLDAGSQRSLALLQYERLRVLLAEEMIAVPEPATTALRDRIRVGDGSDTPGGMQDCKHLPAVWIPFTGRRIELAKLQEDICRADCRLLTILGPGGSGKTRLALEAARAVSEQFDHGACLVPLSALQSPASILPAVVDALDLSRQEHNDLQSVLVNYLWDKQLLLVLDGFENLLEGAGQLVDILSHAPGVKMLVTSRAVLNIDGEFTFRLDGLSYPAGTATDKEIFTSDAVQLLITALQRALPELDPRKAGARRLLQICRHVQGMPLSLVLVGAWGARLRLEEIAERASQNQELFVFDWTDVLARQRSLHVILEHTWDMLNEREQMIFQSLAVFRGAFSRQAARTISGAALHELSSLVEWNLLAEVSPGWYELHELLRQYGREKLVQAHRVEKLISIRHSEFYLRKLQSLSDDLTGPLKGAALAKIELEHDNYRLAWNWAAGECAVEQLAPVIDTLCLYYDLSLRYQDGESACRAAYRGLSKDRSAGSALLLARILTWQSRFARLLGNFSLARRHMDEAQALFKKAGGTVEDAWVMARTSAGLSDPARHAHRLELAAEKPA